MRLSDRPVQQHFDDGLQPVLGDFADTVAGYWEEVA